MLNMQMRSLKIEPKFLTVGVSWYNRSVLTENKRLYSCAICLLSKGHKSVQFPPQYASMLFLFDISVKFYFPPVDSDLFDTLVEWFDE